MSEAAMVTCARACSGGRGADAATLTCSGCEVTSVGPAWAPGSAAEEEIRRRDCDQVALSTHSFQAQAFYARFGYTECGRTPAHPRGHDQIHLVKRFS
jgi:hypothetical protein